MAEIAVAVNLMDLAQVREALELGTKRIVELKAEVAGALAEASAAKRERDVARDALARMPDTSVLERNLERARLDLEGTQDQVRALEGVCRNHEGTIASMKDGLIAIMAREDEAYAFLEQGAATKEIADSFRKHPLKVWLQLGASNLRETEALLKRTEARLVELERAYARVKGV